MDKFDALIFLTLIESREEAQQELDKYGFKVQEIETIESRYGDAYEIVLVDMDDIFPDSRYQVAIQRSDGNAFDISSHDQKLDNTNKKTDFSVMKKMIEILKSWIDQYGDIYFSSHSARKRRIYKKILSKHFEIGDGPMPQIFLIKGI